MCLRAYIQSIAIWIFTFGVSEVHGIVGGTIANQHAYPPLLLISRATDDILETNPAVCSGLLVQDGSYFITSSACILPISDRVIRAGVHYAHVKEVTEQASNVAQKLVLEGVSQPKIDLYSLAAPFETTEYVAPFNLADIGSTLPGEGVFSGWGSVDTRNSGPVHILRTAKLPIVSDEECEIYDDSENFDGSIFCTGNAAGGTAGCGPDTGGPLLDSTTNQPIGLLFYGSCGQPRELDKFASLAFYKDAIEETINFHRLSRGISNSY